VLAAAKARGAAVIAVADVAGPVTVETWKQARAKSRLEGAAKLGGAVSAAKRKTASAAAVDKIRDRWALPSKEYPGPALLAEAGISRNTVNRVLGCNREQFQARHAAAQKRKATRERKAQADG
jgi:hypothetical protein